MSRTARAVAAVFAALFLTGVAWLSWQIGDRSAPIMDAKLAIDGAVQRGDMLRLDVRVFYLRSCRTYVDRALYDATGTKFALPELQLTPGAIGPQHSGSMFLIPDSFAVGSARYWSHPSYACNWFQRVFWPISMPDRYAPFEVVASSQ